MARPWKKALKGAAPNGAAPNGAAPNGAVPEWRGIEQAQKIARPQSRQIRISATAPATRPTPYVTVRAEPSASSSASMSCGGSARGGGGWEIVGGRQSAGGGSVRGGPW